MKEEDTSSPREHHRRNVPVPTMSREPRRKESALVHDSQTPTPTPRGTPVCSNTLTLLWDGTVPDRPECLSAHPEL